MNANELIEVIENEEHNPFLEEIADTLRQQAETIVVYLDLLREEQHENKQLKKEINILKKRIYSLSVSREPKIGDRIILLDDESEGVIERLSIAGGARISFDDGCYGNYTKVELITLFAYKEIICNKCNDTDWVCENHPDQEAHKCNHCGGAGMPCECTKKASKK